MTAAGSAFTHAATMVVADDRPAFADVLAERLTEHCDVRVVACCSDGQTALAAIREHRPDLALLDLRLALLGGHAVLREVMRCKLPTRVLISSARAEPAIVRAALEDGARGYLSQAAPWEEIFAAVRSVAEGQVWVSPLLQDGLNAQLAQPRRTPSERELEVLALAAEGLTDVQIAERMYVSRETVRTNFKRCSEKLGVSGRTALVATALRQGILE